MSALPLTTHARVRVVLCDDVEPFRALLRHSLADEGDIEVVGEAADGREGVRQAIDLHPDVVLLDLAMPECDGLEAIPAIRSYAPGVAIVALSAFSAERMAAPALAFGADAYVEKGVDIAEIADAIRLAAA